jgi:hypothetical protein
MNFCCAQSQQELCHASRIKNANVEAPGGQAAGDLFSIPIKFFLFFAELGIEPRPRTAFSSRNERRWLASVLLEIEKSMTREKSF